MKLKLTIICFLIYFSAFSQQKIIIGKASLLLPKNAIAYSDTALINSLVKNLDAKSEDIARSGLAKNSYKLDGILFNFFEIRSTGNKLYLDNEDKHWLQREGMKSVQSNYLKTSKVLNGNHFLSENFDAKNKGYYNFVCLNQNKQTGIRCYIKYDIANKNKALEVINNLMKSIAFAN